MWERKTKWEIAVWYPIDTEHAVGNAEYMTCYKCKESWNRTLSEWRKFRYCPNCGRRFEPLREKGAGKP